MKLDLRVNPTKQMEQTAQKIAPKADSIERQKKRFIEHLRKNGVVSAALTAAGLARRTAYEHCSKDSVFAELWDDALESAQGVLVAEACRRALVGDEIVITGRNGRKTRHRKKSDTLLILMIKRGDARSLKKRLLQIGRAAIDAVRESGMEARLSEEQIRAIQNGIIKKFERIPTV